VGGFFLDSLIASIAKKIRAESRVSKAEEWPIAEGKISTFGFRESGWSIVPSLTYTYDVDGETHYGPALCLPIRESEKGIASGSMNSHPVLRVRYNPADPLECRLLNEDNPKLLLRINHEVY